MFSVLWTDKGQQLILYLGKMNTWTSFLLFIYLFAPKTFKCGWRLMNIWWFHLLTSFEAHFCREEQLLAASELLIWRQFTGASWTSVTCVWQTLLCWLFTDARGLIIMMHKYWSRSHSRGLQLSHTKWETHISHLSSPFWYKCPRITLPR